MNSAASDQPWVAGVHVLPADSGHVWSPLRRSVTRARYRMAQAALNRVMRIGIKSWKENPAAFQRLLERGRAKWDKPLFPMTMDVDAVKTKAPAPDLVAAPIPSDWFAPRQTQPNGLVFYVHGGSFILERSPRVTSVVARLAAAANARVFAPNYRLAPENPCPAAVEDVVAAYRWHKSLRPEEPVVALAECAGTAILLAALQKLRDAGDELPKAIVLLSPWVDLTLQSWSVLSASLAGTTPYTMESLAVMAHLYLQGMPANDPIASPLFGDFSQFPPILIHASREDILFDDAIRLAERVRDTGGDLTVRFWTDEVHVWERMHSAKSRQSIALAAKFMRHRLDA